MWRERKKLAQVARLQARGQLHLQHHADPTPDTDLDNALAVFGLRQDDGEDDDQDDDQHKGKDKVYLWPCNVATFQLWQQLQTQWRVGGMGDRTGLDYAGVTALMQGVLGIKAKDRAALFKGLQAMEFAVLDVWAEQRASQAT